MKKYLILTYDVCFMGGGQLFVLRRANHLKKLGYDVHIVVNFHSDYFPLKDRFKDYPLYVITEMGAPSILCTKRKVDTLISDLLQKIGDCSDLLIESHTLSMIEWGELIAGKCGAKHLAYLIAEPHVAGYRFNPGLKIFEHKLKNGEFYGCSSTSLKIIFEREDVPSHYINIGYDENEMYDKCEPSLDFSQDPNVFTITTVTRLDKIYVEPLVENTVVLAKKYPKQKFRLIIAGGSKTPGREEYLKTTYCNEVLNIPNLNIVYTGYIEKLGKDIFDISDVFVGMGTASINAISRKCVTLNIDPRDGMQYSSGFFGVDTMNFAYSENGKTYSIFEKLEETFLMSDKQREEVVMAGLRLFEKEFQIGVCFNKIDLVINSLEPVKQSSNQEVSFLYRLCVGNSLNLYHFVKKHVK